jgi:hypothetical protein
MGQISRGLNRQHSAGRASYDFYRDSGQFFDASWPSDWLRGVLQSSRLWSGKLLRTRQLVAIVEIPRYRRSADFFSHWRNMAGQGRPRRFASARGSIALALCAAVTCAAPAEENNTPLAEPIRLCISWSGVEADFWRGQFRVDRGSFSDLKLLGLEPDAAGSIWLEQGSVQIRSITPQKNDSVELTVSSAPDAKIAVELASGPKAAPSEAQVSIADVIRRPYRLDDHGSTIEIRVIPSPSLRISFNNAKENNALIFQPGSQVSFELKPVLPASLHGTTLDVQTTLSPARRKDGGRTDNQKLAVPIDGEAKLSLNIPLQVPEGVYTVHVSVSRASGYLRDKFFPGAATPIAERSFEIAVVDSKQPSPGAAGRWEPVLEIDPTNPHWVERLPAWTQFRRIPGFNHGPLGSVRTAVVNLPLGRFVELPAATDDECPWQAYSLPLEAVGVPHLLEIDYPADQEQDLSINIVEPNGGGIVDGIQNGAHVYVEDLGRSEQTHKQTQRLVFWPKTQAPLLVVSNQHRAALAHFGQIRVLKRSGSLNSDGPTSPANKRLIAAYIARPLLAESVNATEAFEPFANSIGTKNVDDLQTFYESAVRLADYAHHAEFNSAVVTVLADGSSIFPSSHLLVTPRYNTGRAADRCQEVDGLELMLQVFDRERLTFIPALEFATPIPELEELRRVGDSQSTGVELIGPDGQTWLQSIGTRSGSAPYYNILNPRVQQVMLGVVQEIVDRCGAHSAFGGLAVQLTSNGFSQLPPLEWGLDDATIARFTHDTGIQIAASGTNRFAERQAALAGPQSDVWRSWRAAQVADFYARVAAIVDTKGQRKLILTTDKIFDHPALRQKVRPNLLAGDRVGDTLIDVGIDRQRLERIPGVLLCPTRYVEPTSPLPDRAADLEINAAFSRWGSQLNSTAKCGVVLYHRASSIQLSNFAASAPFRVADDMRITSEPTPSDAAARQPYLRAIVQGNPAVIIDGGDLLPTAEDGLVSDLRRVLRQLPLSAQADEIAKQSVVVRTYTTPEQTVILVINTAPWRVDAQVTMDGAQPTTLEPLLDSAKVVSVPAGRQPWNVSLAPYDLQAYRFPGNSSRPIEVRAVFNDAATKELKRHLDDLAGRDLSAPHAYHGLANPGFEPAGGAGAVPGWHVVGSQTNVAAGLDALLPQDGRTSLHVRSTVQLAAIESDPFPIPATGQLAMTVFARSQNTGPGAELRLVFECESEGRPYRHAASVKASDTQHDNQQWGRPLAILDPDLPLDSHGQMRIKFEFAGPGDFWLDNIKLNDTLLPLKFYENSSAEIVKLLQHTHEVQAAYDAGQLQDCIQLLDGYWPHFVMAYTPAAAPIALAARPSSTGGPDSSIPPSPKDEPPSTGFGDRIRHIVPILK